MPFFHLFITLMVWLHLWNLYQHFRWFMCVCVCVFVLISKAIQCFGQSNCHHLIIQLSRSSIIIVKNKSINVDFLFLFQLLPLPRFARQTSGGVLPPVNASTTVFVVIDTPTASPTTTKQRASVSCHGDIWSEILLWFFYVVIIGQNQRDALRDMKCLWIGQKWIILVITVRI